MARTSPPRPVVVTVVVACVVAVGAQVAAALLGPDPADREGVSFAPDCAGQPCRVLATTVVNGMSVELLADRAGTTGRLRAGDAVSGTVTPTRLADDGGSLVHDSLRCAAGPAPVCLVRGLSPRGMVGELYVWKGDAWQRRARTLVSDAGMVALDDVLSDPMPEIVVVRRACGAEVEDADGGTGGTDRDGADGADGADGSGGGNGSAGAGGVPDGRDDPGGGATGTAPGVAGSAACERAPVVAEVLDMHGRRLGCTEPRRHPDQLRGWPEPEVHPADLRPCPPGDSLR